MAITLTLRNSINFATPLLKGQPLMASNFEPALTSGNIVLETMLGPPCKWPFNRANFNFPVTTAGGTDYPESLPYFGYLEKQWLTDGTGKIYQLNGSVALAKESAQNRPQTIAPQYDDNAGNITFRLDQVPDQAYTVWGDYQKKPTLMTSDASPWGVVPDQFGYIFNWGFLCIMSLLTNDSRFPIFESYFIGRLLGAQDGMTEQERNIFIGNWTALSATLTRSQGAVNAGIAARGK